MRTRTRIIGVLAIILIVASVLGYWPERQRRVAVEAERSSLQSRLTVLHDCVRAAQLHVELLNLIDTIERVNYGQAQTQATALFDRVRAELGRTRDEQLRKGKLRQVLGTAVGAG